MANNVSRLPVERWIGVDLDGTLAHYNDFEGPLVIGAPIEPMVKRVQKWLADGKTVKIFTARVASPRDGRDVVEVHNAIQDWCQIHIGQVLPVTCIKERGLDEFWDDKAVQVIPNTGLRVDGKNDR